MDERAELTFQSGPFALIVSVIVFLIAATVSLYAWRRTDFGRSFGWLEALRLTIVALVLMLLNQPEWIRYSAPQRDPAVLVLYDRSRSMQTADVRLNEKETRPDADSSLPSSPRTQPVASRFQAIQPWLKHDAWKRLAADAEILIQPIATVGQPQIENDAPESADEGEAAAPWTNLHQPLVDLASFDQAIKGVVLISDGDWNRGEAPVDAAIRLRSQGIPLYSVPVGSETRLPDVELVSVDVPTFAPVGKTVRIPITIDSSLPREFTTTIRMRSSSGQVESQNVRIQAMGRTRETINWTPEETGQTMLTFSFPPHAEEINTENNTFSSPIAIREEKLKVLIVESYPRWEYRFLRNALSRDPGVEVSCLLFHPQLEKVGGGSQDYIKVFPSEIDQLSQFDVVFLGDVGIGDNQLTPDDCQRIAGLVEQQASGLILMPGWQGRQFTLVDSELKELIPVVFDPTQPSGWGSRIAAHFQLTQRGRTSLLTKLADTAEENSQVWEQLPGFQWYAPVTRAKAGTEVLAVHSEVANQYGRIPLLVTRTFGAGKVLFMGTDAAWRWRKGVEDKYHYRFWGQVIRWMAYQRNMTTGDGMRLYYSPEQPETGQTMSLTAQVMDSSGEPLQSGEVAVRFEAPDRSSETVRLIGQDGQWGIFRGEFTPAQPGLHRLTLASVETRRSLETTVVVRGQEEEPVGKPARLDVMRELAAVTGGKVLNVGELDTAIESLAELPPPPAIVQRLQLWSHPIVGLLIVILMGIFWVGRKTLGLI